LLCIPLQGRVLLVSERFTINDASLESAGECLVAASGAMAKSSARVPGLLASLTGIGDSVHQYLLSVKEARLALTDAAKTGAGAVAGVMRDGKALDRHIAASLSAGFSVPGVKK
jgi:hypothetical protein